MMSGSDEPKKPSHTLADHSYGIDLAHTHDGYADHDHDFPDELPLEENPIWIADHVSLMTVGIDIGSPGPPATFSRRHPRPPRPGPYRPPLPAPREGAVPAP